MNTISFSEPAPMLVLPDSAFEAFTANIEENIYLKQIFPIEGEFSQISRVSSTASQRPALFSSPT